MLDAVKRRGIPQQYTEILQQLVVDNPGIMLRVCRRKLMEAMTIKGGLLPADFPEDTANRSKVSTLKYSLQRG